MKGQDAKEGSFRKRFRSYIVQLTHISIWFILKLLKGFKIRINKPRCGSFVGEGRPLGFVQVLKNRTTTVWPTDYIALCSGFIRQYSVSTESRQSDAEVKRYGSFYRKKKWCERLCSFVRARERWLVAPTSTVEVFAMMCSLFVFI